MKKGIRNRASEKEKSIESGIIETKKLDLDQELDKTDDRWNIALLILLYTLQGIPMGLCGSIPLILKEKGVSYEGLSLFSLVSFPFSLKLLWAPIVDSCYFPSIGRRKSWLLVIQMLTAIFMIFGSQFIDLWIGNDEGTIEPSIKILTIYFFTLYFLMATQDIAVDGWALTILSKKNVSYASTCNAIGQPLGFFLANQGFIALSDSRWCHRFLGLPSGTSLITLAQFMQFWGWVFFIVTIVVVVFQNEKPIDNPLDEPASLSETYLQIWGMCKLKSVRSIAFVLLTYKLAFAASDSISGFKLQEYGMPKSDLATISPILFVSSLLLPVIFSHAMSSRPLDLLLRGIPLRLVGGILIWVTSQLTHAAYTHTSHHHVGGMSGNERPGEEDGGPSILYFLLLIGVMLFMEVGSNLCSISGMSFFSKISDPSIGGTYMTFLNTLSNLGSKWPNSGVLYLLPKLTFHRCVASEEMAAGGGGAWTTESLALSFTQSWSKALLVLDPLHPVCSIKSHPPPSAHTSHASLSDLGSEDVCSAWGKGRGMEGGGRSGLATCEMVLDGYTVLTFGCLLVGLLWLHFYGQLIEDLQSTLPKEWALPPSLSHAHFHPSHPLTSSSPTTHSPSDHSLPEASPPPLPLLNPETEDGNFSSTSSAHESNSQIPDQHSSSHQQKGKGKGKGNNKKRKDVCKTN